MAVDRTIPCWENDGRQRTQLHFFAACRRLLLRVLNMRSGVNGYPQCRLRWLVLGRDDSAQRDSTQLHCFSIAEYHQSVLYLGLLVQSVDLCAVERDDRRSDRSRERPPWRSRHVVVLLTTTAAVDVCGMMRREGKGTGQMIDPHPQCMVHTAPIFDTATVVVC